jgi:chloramphenicol-sensitive protein RarD
VTNIRSRRSAAFCFGSGIMVGLNWLLFIWAVNIGHVLETSLGYFMTPLVNVLLGALILRERLSAWQIASILIGFVAVSILAFGYGHFPWIAVGICSSFGLYGLLRKQSRTAAIPGLFLETLFLLPLALVYLFVLTTRGLLTFGTSHLALSAILTTTGVVTAVPLIWFGYAARHLRLVTIGFLQYLSPSISFVLGLFVYHEIFTRQHFITFVLIWFALALVSTEAVMRWHATKRVSEESPEAPLIEPGI